MPVKKEESAKDPVKKKVENAFKNPNKNRLNLRCQREHAFMRPATMRPIKVS